MGQAGPVAAFAAVHSFFTLLLDATELFWPSPLPHLANLSLQVNKWSLLFYPELCWHRYCWLFKWSRILLHERIETSRSRRRDGKGPQRTQRKRKCWGTREGSFIPSSFVFLSPSKWKQDQMQNVRAFGKWSFSVFWSHPSPLMRSFSHFHLGVRQTRNLSWCTFGVILMQIEGTRGTAFNLASLVSLK